MWLSLGPSSQTQMSICGISNRNHYPCPPLKFQITIIVKKQWFSVKTNGVVHAYTIDFPPADGIVSGPLQVACSVIVKAWAIPLKNRA